MNLTAELMEVRLVSVRLAAQDMKLYELAPVQGALPPAGPGAHIDLHLPGGLVRQYSLVSAAPQAYVLGVKREAEGRGGSRWLHDEGRAGQLMKIGGPRNHFPLHAGATHSVLVAGGIGITPIYAMARQLQAEGASWELHYGCRSRAWCAFHDELLALGGAVHFYFDDELGPGAIAFASLAARAASSEGTHLYCCGPQGMLDAYQRGCADLPPARVHLEHFAAPAAPVGAATDGSFTLKLARSARQLEIPAGRSILECLAEIGIEVPYSCSQGVCGSCETRVLEGTPEHRDVVLDESERASGKTMMVCCSRAATPSLTLDL